MKTLLLIMLLLLPFTAQAGILPQDKKDEMVQIVLKGFWGRAKLPDGSFIEPKDAQDRQTVPVNESALNVAFDAAEVSGLAEWCGLDWRNNFQTMMASARRHGLDERQVAFIGTLHGFVSRFMHDTMKSRSCDATILGKTQAMLQQSITRLQK